jgi:tetratricopeptide (TPR) repeat protein
MAQTPRSDAFISYRRDASYSVALALYQGLAKRGVDVFIDVESVGAGEFAKETLDQIASRPYFLLVLSPGTLKRCIIKGDLVRAEIDHALKTARDIVPIRTGHFEMSDLRLFLPAHVALSLERSNMLLLDLMDIESGIDRLQQSFLRPRASDSTQTKSTVRAMADRATRKARKLRKVSEAQLAAQELFERAVARGQEDVEGCLADLTASIKLDPMNITAYHNRALMWVQSRNFKHAEADVSEELARFPRAPGTLRAEALRFRGQIRTMRGNRRGAITDYSDSIRLNPQQEWVHLLRGDCWRELGRLDIAVADYTRALSLDPLLSPAFNNRGVARETLGDRSGALNDYSEAIRVDPSNAEAWNNRGFLRQCGGDLYGAAGDYAEAIRLNPEFVEALHNRSALSTLLNDHTGGDHGHAGR